MGLSRGWALVCAGTLAGAPLARAKPATAQADTLVVGLLADPVSLDPHRATDFVSAALISNVCETLVRQRPGSARPEPGLATSWATRDNRRFTLTLRENVRFQDGSPFDADAVVANFDELRRRGVFAGRAERIGPHALGITLERPNAALLSSLSLPSLALQSPRALGQPAVGTGPFRLGRTRAGHYELLAEAHYWGGAPRLARVVFERFADERALVGALLAGRADVSATLGPAHLDELRRAPQLTLDSQTGLNLAFLSINNKRAPFDDRRVRQALTRLVARQAIVDQVLRGHGLPAEGPLPPALGRLSSAHVRPADRVGARRLLAQAGYARGLSARLLVPGAPRPYLPDPEGLARRLAADFALAGVRVELEPVAGWSEYIARCTRGDYELALLGWQADTLDANDFLSALVGTQVPARTNRSGYSSPAMDLLLERARRSSDPAQRASLYREAQTLFQRDMPWVPLYHTSIFTAYRKSVHGLLVGPTGVTRYDKAWKTE